MLSSQMKNINLFLNPEGCPIVGSAVKKGKIVICTRQLAFFHLIRLQMINQNYRLFTSRQFSVFEESPCYLTQCMPFVKYPLPLLTIIYPVAAPEWINSYSALTCNIRACSSNRNMQPLCYVGKESLLFYIYGAWVLLCPVITEVFY